MGRRPTGIDLFAGAGGLSLGFEQAGFDVVAAVELDPIHCATHKFNFPRCKTIPRSVADLTGRAIREESGLGDMAVDVVFGGAPCQGFSLIGQRALDDPRNSLVREFVRLVAELEPRHFVFENVKGLTVGRQKRFLDELIDAFRAIGYAVQTPWQVLNACRFGVPQDRQRLILLGARGGERLPEYPLPTSSKPGFPEGRLPQGPTCRDALDDLPEAESFVTLNSSDSVRTSRWGEASNYAAQLRCDNGKGWYWGYRRRFDRELLTSSMRTAHTEISIARFRETEQGTVEPISRFFKLPEDGVSNTLRAGTDSARGAFTSPRPIHYRSNRCVTVREMARLHGFPDWFRFHVTKWHGARQIGNSVPPPLARAIAEAVVSAAGVKPTTPRSTLSLGDESLLRMDATQAAEFFGVPNPIEKRNMKSGVRKRKQEQIEELRRAEASNGS